MKRGLIGAGFALALGVAAVLSMGQGTTPAGSASELAAWPQGHADTPFCVGVPALGCIYADGGASGALVPHTAACPFYVTLSDGGLSISDDCQGIATDGGTQNIFAIYDPYDLSPPLAFTPVGNGLNPAFSITDLNPTVGIPSTTVSITGSLIVNVTRYPDAGPEGTAALIRSQSPAGQTAFRANNGANFRFGSTAQECYGLGANTIFCTDLLEIDGGIKIDNGGLTFPDATVQTTAASNFWRDAGAGDIVSITTSPIALQSSGIVESINTSNQLLVRAANPPSFQNANQVIDMYDSHTGASVFRFGQVNAANPPWLTTGITGGVIGTTKDTGGTTQNLYLFASDFSGASNTVWQASDSSMVLFANARRVAIASTTDDGVNALQVNGTVKIANAVQATQAAAFNQLPQAGRQALTAGTATVTFATAYASTPSCVCTDETSVLAAQCAPSTTQLVITVTAGGTNTVDWHCIKVTQ